MPGLAKLVFLANDCQLLAIRKANIVPLPIASLAEFPQLVIKQLITLAVKCCHDKLSRCVPWVGVELVRSPVLQDSSSLGCLAGTPISTARCGLALEPSHSQAQVVSTHCFQSAQQSWSFVGVLMSLC